MDTLEFWPSRGKILKKIRIFSVIRIPLFKFKFHKSINHRSSKD
jgi:hypothetical protein